MSGKRGLSPITHLMEWRGTSKGKSIFDGKERRLGRPLTALEKAQVIAKYTAIIALISVAPFISTDLWEFSHLHKTPLVKSYTDVSLRLGGGGKSPPVIVITDAGKRVFVSPCEGLLKAVVCREEYSGDPVTVDMVDVIEISPGKGIIKHLILSDESGKKFAVTNQYANDWVQSYPKSPYQKNWFLLMVAGGAILVFLVMKISSIIINRQFKES
ncbi:MAG: hypothetical protein PHD68_10690 [Rugosibacter sp.]|nr:hypothetical protein [Rugosibacter sp.]